MIAPTQTSQHGKSAARRVCYIITGLTGTKLELRMLALGSQRLLPRDNDVGPTALSSADVLARGIPLAVRVKRLA